MVYNDIYIPLYSEEWSIVGPCPGVIFFDRRTHGGPLVEAPTKDATMAMARSRIFVVPNSLNDGNFNDEPVRF